MKHLFIVISLMTAGSLYAQEQPVVQSSQQAGPGVQVRGRVLDSATAEPLAFSTIAFDKSGDKAGAGINADSAGYFVFENIEPGTYFLSVFYVGYPKMEDMVSVGDTDVDLGVIRMSTGNILKEVTIVDYKQLIEQRPDGLVYNAEKDITNKGTTSEQLLRKVPMVTVDLDGNVQLRGSDNIRVFIDGKPSTIIAASVKDALRQIPSYNIKTVEVITNPGARYDAEGAAGVINIVTKKNLMKGISGSVFSQLSYNVPREFFTGNAGFNLNYRNKNFGMALNAGYSRWQMFLNTLANRTDFPGTGNETRLRQSSEFDGLGDFFWSQLSADYQIDSLQSVHAGVNYNPGNWKQDVVMNNQLTPATVNAFTRNTHSAAPRHNIGMNAGYSRKFKDNPKRSLDILAQYAINNTNSEYELSSVEEGATDANYREQNSNQSSNKEFTIQADYVHPLKKAGQKIETGLKFINRDIESDYELKYWIPSNGSAFVTDPRRTNRLEYAQQVMAAYGQFAANLSKPLSLVVGARYEFTNIDGHQQEVGSGFQTQFNNLLPNISLGYTLKNFSKLKLAYNMRIERPSINFVNPFINYSDQFNLSQGNPALVPENTHNVELGYSTFYKTTSLNISTFYRHTGNAIENVTTVGSDNVSRTTFQNIAKNNTIGFDVFLGGNLFGKWMINLNGSAYYKMLNSPSLNISNSGWQYSGNVYSSFKLSERFSIAGYGMYNGTRIQLQGSQNSWFYYFLGLQATVLKGKGTVTLAGENFFHPEIKMTTRYNYQNADYTMVNTYYGRGLRLTFNWSFGKMQFLEKKKVKNDDLKKADDGQPGMGGGL
jgi:ferric enterobactin receptor